MIFFLMEFPPVSNVFPKGKRINQQLSPLQNSPWAQKANWLIS